MRRTLAVLTFLALAACTPPQSGAGAEAAVQGIYATAQQNVGHAVTPTGQIPMTDELKSLVDRAQAQADARDEPFLEGDLVLNCQDCSSVSDLIVGPQTGAEQEPTVDGHTWVQATFKLNGDEDRLLLWDMVETPQGWRVDNILTEGLNLRAEAESYLASPAPAEPAAP